MQHGCGIDDAQDRDDAKPAPKPVTVHALEVANYSLKPLDFGAPAVHEVTPLKVANYSLGPLAFDAPAWRQGYWHTYIVWGKPGQPPRIPADVEKRMIAATEIWL